MQVQFYLINAEVFNRLLQINAAAFNVKTGGLDGSGNVTNGDRTVQLTGLGCLTNQNGTVALKGFGLFGCFVKQSLVVGFEFGLFLFIEGNVGFGSTQSFVLRQQVVAGITIFNGYFVAHFTQFFNMF